MKRPGKIADVFLSMGVKRGNKMGNKGCFIKSDKEQILFPHTQYKAVDTTGAGDSFAAGFLPAIQRMGYINVVSLQTRLVHIALCLQVLPRYKTLKKQ